jgi:hypothetical protein
MTKAPRDPFSEVVDERRRWNPEWYTFMQELAESQPLDGDLTSLASASLTGVMYYRSAPDTWSPVAIGSGLTFVGGTLAAQPPSVVQEVYAELTAFTGIVTAMAGGVDTVPQQTDGTQILAATITPHSVSNRLRVQIEGVFTASNPTWFALFKDSTADAFAARLLNVAATDIPTTFLIVGDIAAGTVSPTTIKLRIGNIVGNATAVFINGFSGGRILGGAQRTTMRILEIVP